jgi:uncharacterized membrane protein YphA (DoxX/SURF4 family)
MPALDPVYSLTIAILIAFVFAAAGIHKAMNFSHHAGVVADYRVVPAWVVPLLAPLIIILEFAVVLLVLVPETRSAGVILTAGLLFIYIFSIALNLVRGRTSIDCGCSWGSQGNQISAWMVVRNLIMVAVALLLLLPSANRSLQLTDWVLAALAGTALIAI